MSSHTEVVEAGVDAGTDVHFSTFRRPTLLWQLTSDEAVAIECWVMQLNSGRVVLDVVQCDAPRASQIFDDTAAAVRRAFQIERSLMLQGWAKTI